MIDLNPQSPPVAVERQRRLDLILAIEAADALMERDPDIAALQLDGLILRIAAEWFALHRRPQPSVDAFLSELERLDQAIAWRLRVALRAPNAHARLIHCRAAIAEMNSAS